VDLDNAFFERLALVPNLRSAAFVDVDMAETAKGYTFDGIAAPTGVTADLGEFTEEYERGSFRRFLASCRDNIPLCHEHNPRDLLATTRSGRLKLSEDGKGLRAKADVVKTPLSETIKTLVDAGEIGGMSIGMLVGRDNSKVALRDGRPHRLIQNFRKLLDVCTTFDPAYVATEAQFRSMSVQYADSPESLQQLLLGAYPQLQAQGGDLDGTDEEKAPADDQTPPDGADESVGEGDGSGVVEQRTRSVAARRRALSLYLIEHGEVT
jgi:HK97 family phage prohead protease